MTWRYGERGYRYLLLDAGHICQNLYLSGLSLGCGTCAIAAFEDDDLNSVLDLDGQDEFVVYGASLGKRRNPLE
jgi:SagB-type dehydrogenase family enzyme